MTQLNSNIEVPNDWSLISAGVLAPNKNDPNLKYYGELYSTPNGFMHMISIFRVTSDSVIFKGSKAHLLKPDSTVLYWDPNVSYISAGEPIEAITEHLNNV